MGSPRLLLLALFLAVPGPAKGSDATPQDVELVERILKLPERIDPFWRPIHQRLVGGCAQARRLRASGMSPREVQLQVASGSLVGKVGMLHDYVIGKGRFALFDGGEQIPNDCWLRLTVGYHYLVAFEGWSPAALVGLLKQRVPRFLERLQSFEKAVQGNDRAATQAQFRVMAPTLAGLCFLGPPVSGSTRATPLPASPAASPAADSGSASASPPAPASPPGSAGQAKPPGPGPSRRPRAGGALLVVLAIVGSTVYALRRRRRVKEPAQVQTALNLMARGKNEEALPLLQRAVASFPQGAQEVRCHVVRCLLRLGQLELALQAYSELDASKAPPRAIYLLARDLEERSQLKQATELYARLYLAASDFEDVKTRYESIKARQGNTSSITSMQDLIARLPARYAGVQRLGEGGMGIVLRATDTQLKCEVAIKIISPLAAEDQSFIRRFRREVKALALLAHPNIVRIMEFQSSPIHFYTMEYFAAPSLGQALDAGPLPTMRVLEIGAQVAQALECAHRQGIVHRDIKPENVLVGEDDLVKVVDFGLAQVEGATVLTRSGQAPGTLHYMAPEQLKGEKVGPPADVYALGLLLHEMVRGEPAFPSDGYAARLVQPPPPLPPDPKLGDELARLVSSCTLLDPAARPAAGAVATELSRMRSRAGEA